MQGALLVVAGAANADFYSYVGKDGVMVYTNIPTSDDAIRVMREREERPEREAARKRKALARKETATAGEERPQPVTEARLSPLEPVMPVYGVVTSSVGWRQDPIDRRIRHHNGMDIAVPTGTAVKAIAAGTVIESGWHGGYGNLVKLDHGNGVISMYGHNNQLGVRAGDQVEAGQIIALSGSTGRSTGPHLHFEIWNNGENVTRQYFGAGNGMPEVAKAVKRQVASDGSIVFTNTY